MALVIKDAVKKHLRARIGLLAPTGGGKTFTGLKFLFCMVKLGMAKKVGVIDTEHGSASKYIGDPFPAFRVIEMTDDFAPEQYIEAMQIMADDGVDALLIDSLSHAWAGKGGSLELKDKFGKQKGFNDYTAWGPVTAMQNRMIESLLSYPGHLIATMRLKMEHVLEEDPITKKKVVRKIGLQPVQRDGMEYELDLVGDLDQDHNFSVSKTRCSALDGYTVNKPGEEVIRKMKAWLESGEAEKVKAAPRPTVAAPTAAAKPEEPPATFSLPAVAAAIVTQSMTEPPAVTVPPSSEPAPASRPADAFAEQMRAAQTPDALEGVALALAPAVKAGAVSEAEKKMLVNLYLGRKKALTEKAA